MPAMKLKLETNDHLDQMNTSTESFIILLCEVYIEICKKFETENGKS